AADEQHQKDGAEEHAQRRTRATIEVIFEGLEVNPITTVLLWICRREPGCHGRQIRARGLPAHAVPQSSQADQDPKAAIVNPTFRAWREGAPELAAARNVERGRHDTDDRGGLAIDRDCAPDYGRIAAEKAPPEALVKDDHGRRAGSIVGGLE